MSFIWGQFSPDGNPGPHDWGQLNSYINSAVSSQLFRAWVRTRTWTPPVLMINLLFSYSLTYIQGRKGLAQQIEVKTKDQTTRPWLSLNGGKWYTVPLEHNEMFKIKLDNRVLTSQLCMSVMDFFLMLSELNAMHRGGPACKAGTEAWHGMALHCIALKVINK